MIGESWLRCRRRGKDPHEGSSAVVATGPELETILAENRSLIEAARPFMDILCASLGKQDFVVVLADRNGYMLESFGSEEILHSAFRMHYARGARLTEELNGTTEQALPTFLLMARNLHLLRVSKRIPGVLRRRDAITGEIVPTP